MIPALFLAACDTAGPGFRGLDQTHVDYEGSRFTLRRQGDVVEAIRTNPEMLPKFETVARKAGIATQIETGCTAAWVVGDPSMMWIGLSCEGAKAPPIPRKTRVIFCDLSDLTPRGGSLECQKI